MAQHWLKCLPHEPHSLNSELQIHIGTPTRGLHSTCLLNPPKTKRQFGMVLLISASGSLRSARALCSEILPQKGISAINAGRVVCWTGQSVSFTSFTNSQLILFIWNLRRFKDSDQSVAHTSLEVSDPKEILFNHTWQYVWYYHKCL